ncbi:hypothetical protein QQ045_008228 [Rhodiola kirilowii]
MPPLYFPLRWESTGDQWWYACPIDYAAANGHYESTRELLRLDANNLIKFTSLRRIRRLETVWDDNEQFHDVAKCRAQVAHKLYIECETKGINNSLVRAGYGGWLLYTAASAGDLHFVQQLLQKDPLLVFGEGEYGVTDILYAAATSKSCQVFKLLFDFAISPRFDEVKEYVGEVPSAFKTEMINRAMHAAARGGNIQVLKYLLQNYCSDILAYRDVQGSTILHAAASKGQVQVVEEVITCFDNIINATDNQGNTALHIAAYKGQLGVVESLVAASPSAILLKNNAGENFLHMAVSGYKTHAFRRMDQQTDFMKQLVSREIFNIKSIINDKNHCGRTVLHLAIIGNIHSDLVQLLMTVCSIDVNVRDSHGMTPLDHLRQQPASALSDRLTRDLVSAGGICGSAAKTHNMVSRLRAQSTTRSSPGTLFEISDAEILLNTGLDAAAAASILKSDPGNGNKIVGCDILKEEVHPKDETCNSVLANRHSNGFKRILHWPKVKDKRLVKKNISTDMSSVTSTTVRESSPVPLRQRFSKASSSVSSPSNNKRPLSVRSELPSPAAKKKLASAAGLKTGAVPLHFARRSRSSSFSQTSNSSPKTIDKQKCGYVEYEIGSASFANQLDDDDITPRLVHKQGSLKYLCFGAPSLCGKDPDSRHHLHVHARSRSDVSVA